MWGAEAYYIKDTYVVATKMSLLYRNAGSDHTMLAWNILFGSI